VTVAWVNGELVAADAAGLVITDHGLVTGDGVFETLRVYRGTPFAIRRHLDRLEHSARGLGMVSPSRSLLERAMAEVVAANATSEARLRLTVTTGPGPLASHRGEAAPTVIAALAPLPDLPDAYPVAIAPWPRNDRSPLAGLKTLSYAENVVALDWAKQQGAREAILANLNGDLCEGTGTNVFLVLDGRLLTPPLESGCLAGVTRALVIELTGAADDVVPVAALADAEEAFVTGTGCEVMPIVSVDGRPLPQCPGPITVKAAAAFRALVAHDLNP
jgi:branched-chain amino acid aminotransferase